MIQPRHFFVDRHLEKTPIGYIQWRFQDGHDRKVLLPLLLQF